MALEANLTENGLVKIASGAALGMRAGASRDVMEVHRMLVHPSEDITRKTVVMMGIETTGQWGACEMCFQVKAKRHAVPKKTDERASVRGQRFFVDVGGPMKHSSLGGNSYVVIFVDDCTRFKVVRFVKKKSDTTAALLSLIVDYITPQKLSIKCIRTDNGGEFEGEFQRELDRRSITHEHTPPDTPQYNRVAERALGLLREKAIILMEELDDVINVPREKLWAQAMLFACDVTNKSVTTSTDGGKSPYELWFGKFPTADHLRPFGAVGYARQSVREHKMAPKGEKCVFMGIPRNFPTGTVSVLLVRSRNIVERQAVQWIDGPKKTGGDGTGSDNRGMKSAGDEIIVERGTPQLNVQELGQEQQLTLHEHETQEVLSELEGETQGRRRGRYRNMRRRRRRRFRKTSESSSMRRGERNLHWDRQIWRDRPYPRCVSSPSTAISRPYCHHVQGVEDPTPVWREKRCIVSCRRSRPKRKTAWRMRWRATTGARWPCRRR